MSVETEDEHLESPAGADFARDVDAAITSRRSIRAFRPTPVPRRTIAHILEVAARAPSGTNMQPWNVHVVAGAAKDRLSEAILDAYWAGAEGHKRVWKYYPDEFFEPYKTRRRTVGWTLYGALGIERGQTDKMKAQRARNFAFFDAPVGMVFTIDERLEIGSWLDYGMFLQNIMIAARAQGLHTCPQAAFGDYHKIIRRQLDIADDQTVICGMSVGYADVDDPANSFTTERAPLDDFVRFIGYDD